jgi:hypothetical protein
MTERSKTGNSFPSTRWSVILDPSHNEETRMAALERLFKRYRLPIIKHIQAHANSCKYCSAATAGPEELGQQFISAKFLKREFLENVSPEKGRFRDFVRTCIDNFLNDYHRRVKSGIRNPGLPTISLEEENEQGGALKDKIIAPEKNPEQALDHLWALNILECALAELERECVARRKGELFSALKPCLDGSSTQESLKEIAQRFEMLDNALSVALHRLRKRYGELIAEEIRQTVGIKEDWREELKYLQDLLSRTADRHF